MGFSSEERQRAFERALATREAHVLDDARRALLIVTRLRPLVRDLRDEIGGMIEEAREGYFSISDLEELEDDATRILESLERG